MQKYEGPSQKLQIGLQRGLPVTQEKGEKIVSSQKPAFDTAFLVRRGGRHFVAGVSAIVLATMMATPASAQSAEAAPASPGSTQNADGQLADIVVTAQRRTENLQNVPIAASVVDASALLQRNVVDVRDVAQIVPNLRIDSAYGNAFPKLTLRGVGSGTYNQNSEATVALYMDDFVLNPPASKLGQLFDIQRVEVLRGPQGTLYGKNTTAGAINLVTRRPDGSTTANVSVTVARYGEYDILAGAQTALTDDLSVRAAFKRRYSDGYGFNTLTDRHTYGNDDWAGRLGLRYKVADADIYLKVFADRSRAQSFYTAEYGVNPDGSPTPNGANPLTGYIRPANIDVGAYQNQRGEVDNRGVGLNVDQKLGSLTLSLVGGYLFSKQDLSQDADGSPLVFVEVDPYSSKAKQLSGELRLSSPTEGPFTWTIGLSGFHQRVHFDNQAIISGFAAAVAGFGIVLPPSFRQQGSVDMTSFAGFADGTYHLTDKLSIFAGLRVTTDRQSIDMAPLNGISLIGPYHIQQARRWTEPTYRAGVNFQLNPSTLLYASYNRGYRAGTYDTSFVGSPDQIRGPVNPEFVDSYEAGLKATFFDRRVRLNVAAFYTRFTDQQLPIVGPTGLCCALANAGKSRIYGVEFEGAWRVTRNFDINLSGAVTDGKYIEFNTGSINLSGQDLGNLAKYEVRLSPEYRIPAGGGQFFIAPEAVFVGKSRRSTAVDPFGQDVQPAYTVINGQVGYRFAGDRYSVFAFVKNATNKRYLTDFASSPGFGFKQLWYSAPVTWGLTATANF